MNNSSLLKEIRNFVALQILLATTFRSTFDQVQDFEFMLDAPKNGCIDTGEGLWLFKKHGIGLAFINWDGVKIDIHKHFEAPHLFDAWRFKLYLESIYMLDEFENGVEAELLKLVSSGDLIKHSDRLYQLP